MTTPAPTLAVLCAPWATTADLPASPALPAITDAEWERLLLRASEILYAYSGRQWTGGGCESLVRFGQVRPGHCWWVPIDLPWPVLDLLGHSTGATLWTVRLPAAPITAVTSVTIDGDPLTAGDDYGVHTTSGLLERYRAPWPTDGSLYVTYTYGLPPPAGGVAAAARLAVELARYSIGDKTCRLPSNATSATREGVTITMVARDGSPSGLMRTGLVDVDMWLDSVNPRRMTRRPSVWSPGVPLGRTIRP